MIAQILLNLKHSAVRMKAPKFVAVSIIIRSGHLNLKLKFYEKSHRDFFFHVK